MSCGIIAKLFISKKEFSAGHLLLAAIMAWFNLKTV
jgi:hypothetical protein